MIRPVFFMPLVLVFCLSAATAAGSGQDPEFYTLQIGDPRPELHARSFSDGHSLTWKELEGEVAVVDFWATWCAPCVEAFPKFNNLVETFADRPVRFVSVTYESESMIRPFLENHPLETTVALDDDFKSFRSFMAWGIPAVYIFNPGGDLVSVIHPEDLSRRLLEAVLLDQIPEVEQSRGWSDPEGAEEYFRSLAEKGK